MDHSLGIALNEPGIKNRTCAKGAAERASAGSDDRKRVCISQQMKARKGKVV
ncbi:MAG: hypothetical protein GF421_02280 [Candidatus Aminicenantes bacterium]|nr:hypothetical protein [Candidatus Aminicenantes bacterium]